MNPIAQEIVQIHGESLKDLSPYELLNLITQHVGCCDAFDVDNDLLQIIFDLLRDFFDHICC